MSEYNAIYEGLQKRRLLLQTRVGNLKKDGEDPLNRDSEEQAAELEDSEVQGIIYEEALKEIARINKTLDMIEKNEYGRCIECGEQIPLKRLAAVPLTNNCIKCAETK